MQWLKDLWNRIVSSNDEQYLIKIKELETASQDKSEIINNLLEDLAAAENQLDKEIDNYLFMKSQFELMQNLKNDLLEELETYKKVDVPFTVPTDIIDTNSFAYLPNTLIYYYNSATKKIATKSVPVTVSKFYRMWTDEMYLFFRDSIKDCKTFDEKVVKLRDVIKSIVDYKFDLSGNGLSAGENWRMPTETFYGGIGDCEDTTSLWVTACHICGLPADRIFNATGEYKAPAGFIGHSYGLAKLDNGEWWVIETTSTRPKQKLLGSKEYFIRGTLNGLSNWEMSGKAINSQF